MRGIAAQTTSSPPPFTEIFTMAQIALPSQACKQCLVMTVLTLPACQGVIPAGTAPSVNLNSNAAMTTEQKKCACYLGQHPDWVEPCGNTCPAEVLFFLEGRFTATRNVNCATTGRVAGENGAANGVVGSSDSTVSKALPPNQKSQQEQKSSSSTALLSAQRDRMTKCSKIAIGFAVLTIGLQILAL
ncbi:hypothetical protein BGZ73_003809 [Actinomortierella ambigua]|nr:hypothetical protein BGZ73_003809 [Actinomortierella ambigua]